MSSQTGLRIAIGGTGLGFAGRGGGAQTIGGIAVGTPGAGTYTGYTLAGGDDFTASIGSQLVKPGTPYGNIAHNFSERDRRLTSTTSVFALADPYWTGWQDANDGVPVSSFSDVLVQTGSVLQLKARRATAAEKLLTGLRDNTAAAITYVTGGDANGASSKRPMVMAEVTMLPAFAYTGDRIVEIKWKYTPGPTIGGAGNPGNAIWELNLRGGSEAGDNAGAEYNDEADWEEAHLGSAANIRRGNTLTDGGTWGVKNDGTYQISRATCSDGTFKLETLSADGQTLIGSGSFLNSAQNQTQLFYLMFGQIVITTSYDENQWVGKEALFEIDWVRVWTPTASQTLKPLMADAAPVVIAFGGTGSYVIPSQASLWGGAVDSEVIQFASAYDTNGPGRASDQVASIQTRDALPVGVTYNSGTRTLSFSTAFAAQAGVIHGYVYPKKAGSNFVKPHRFAVYVKPSISMPTPTAPTPGSPYTYTFSRTPRNWDNGNLPNGVNSGISLVSGPAWLSFDPATFILSGNCPGGFTSATLTFRCTNGVGLSTDGTCVLSTTPVYAYQSWTGPGWFDASDTSKLTLSGSTVLTMLNKRASGGDLTAGGTSGNITSVAAVQNGKAVVRVARDVSSSAAVPRLKANATDPISQAFQGDDQPFTVIFAWNPTDANTAYPWSASKTIDAGGNNTHYISVVRRAATASDIRRTATTAAGQVAQTWGSGDATSTPRIIAVKYSGTAVTVWDNSATTKSLNAAALNTADMGTLVNFYLFASEVNGGATPTYNTISGNLDFYECLVENTARSDADIQQAITDLATKWAVTLT